MEQGESGLCVSDLEKAHLIAPKEWVVGGEGGWGGDPMVGSSQFLQANSVRVLLCLQDNKEACGSQAVAGTPSLVCN